MMKECMLLLNTSRKDGYVRIERERRTVYAHRYMYEQLVDEIPTGMTLDHLCRNKACVNPKHLEVVTLQENLSRRPKELLGRPRKELCIRIHKSLSKRGECKVCKNESNRRYRLRQKVLV